jgi:predicted permease
MAIGGVLLWRKGRRHAAMASMGVVALAYPATLAARFTSLGAEISARSAEFVFVGLAFVVALAAIWLLSYLSWRFIEIPGRELVIRWLSPKAKAKPAPAT